MRERRFLVAELSQETEVEIRGPEAHHLLHVLRLRPGDEVVVFDGQGLQFRSVITRCEESYAVVRLLEQLPQEESPLELHLAVAVPKGDKMSLIVRILTELGASRIIPLVTKRTIIQSPRMVQKRWTRWKRIAVEACKQSGRSGVLEVKEPLFFKDVFDTELPPERILVCPGGARLAKLSNARSCLALIGPEGGWTDDEIRLAEEHGFKKMGLGPRTLRTETAAVAIASILQWEWGDLCQGDRRKRGD